MNSDNGILAQVGGTFIAEGTKFLSPPAAGEVEPERRFAVVDVPHLGPVRIRYRLNRYKHGRSWHWSWVAEHAETAVS